MRAAVYERPGGPEVISIKEVPKPELLPGTAIIRVEASSLNHVDIWGRIGLKGIELPYPSIPGSDVAGVVDESTCDKFRKGDRVVVYPLTFCGRCEACISGRENLCPQFRLIGFHTDGGHAEYIRVPCSNLLPMPDEANFENVAALPVAYTTAWNSLVNAGGLKPDERVLILGGGSGVGTAAIRIAQLIGAEVIATAGFEWKLDRLREMGVRRVINHSEEEIYEKVMELTDGEGVDVVLEQVGSATFEASLKCLKRGGRLVTMATTTGGDVQLNLRDVFSRNLTVRGVYVGNRSDLFRVLKLVAEKKLDVTVDSVFDLEKLPDAHGKMESRNLFGKIIIKP